MPGTTVRSAAPEVKSFKQEDWKGIQATIRPAGVVEERARQELVKHRSEAYEPSGAIRIESDVNTIDLWYEEIWLTYEDINVTNDKGERIALQVKEGDRVLFGKYSGNDITIDGEEHLIMREDDIIAIVQ